MRKLYGFVILISISLYLIYLYLDPRRIFTFITERYYYIILGSGLVLLVIGIIGVYYIIKNNLSASIESGNNPRQAGKYENILTSVSTLIKDKKFTLIYVLTVLGLIVHPLFLILCAFLFLIRFKDSKFDSLLSTDIFKPFLLCLVILLGVILPSGQISSATADQRIGNFNSVNLNYQGQTINNFNSDTTNYDIGDWIISLSYNPELSDYVGKSVEVTGFVFHPGNLPEKTFLVSRFVIRCCAADATPVGLKVDYDWEKYFKTDEWVQVKGKFEIRNINGSDDLIIIPESVEQVEVPERPYIN